MRLKKKILALLIAICAVIFLPNITVYASGNENFVYLGGIPAGFTLKTNGATVIGLNDVVTADGMVSPSRNGDIRIGDVILSVNDVSVSGLSSITEILKNCKGEPLRIKIKRNGEISVKYVLPGKDVGGNYRLGLFLRDDLNGIGTITFFKSNGDFGALGHPVLDENGEMLEILGGNCYLCSIIGLVKGEKGKAGELKGIFLDSDKIGELKNNNNTGLYGAADKNYDYKKFSKVETGEGVVGNASIITCIDGVTPKEYHISIVKVDSENKENKNYVIKINDKELLRATNGILQGMSGSPILQNGKLIGAVTHVFINDPSRGFGINIGKMLEN